MAIGKIYQDVQVHEFHVKRDCEEWLVWFEFTAQGNSFQLALLGVRDPDGLCEILQANRLWIEKPENANCLEFGAYVLGVSHEYATEIIFDELAEAKQIPNTSMRQR